MYVNKWIFHVCRNLIKQTYKKGIYFLLSGRSLRFVLSSFYTSTIFGTVLNRVSKFSWKYIDDPFFFLSYWLTCLQESQKRLVIPRGGGGGGTLIVSYIHRLGTFFGSKFWISIFFWVFQKNKYFFWVWRFCGYFLGVITKLDYI